MIYTRAGIPGTRAGTPDCRGASSESLRLVKPKLPKMHSGEFSRKIQKKRPRAEKLSEHKKTEITAIGRCSCIYIYINMLFHSSLMKMEDGHGRVRE